MYGNMLITLNIRIEGRNTLKLSGMLLTGNFQPNSSMGRLVNLKTCGLADSLIQLPETPSADSHSIFFEYHHVNIPFSRVRK
jgi:hypothetical protein